MFFVSYCGQCCLQVRMADGELRASSGPAHSMRIELAPDMVQLCNFWFALLTMDAISGLKWLRGVWLAID